MFKLEIKTDNEAFEENKVWEVQRIVDRVYTALFFDGKREGKCIDLNGNIVGQWSLTED